MGGASRGTPNHRSRLHSPQPPGIAGERQCTANETALEPTTRLVIYMGRVRSVRCTSSLLVALVWASVITKSIAVRQQPAYPG